MYETSTAYCSSTLLSKNVFFVAKILPQFYASSPAAQNFFKPFSTACIFLGVQQDGLSIIARLWLSWPDRYIANRLWLAMCVVRASKRIRSILTCALRSSGNQCVPPTGAYIHERPHAHAIVTALTPSSVPTKMRPWESDGVAKCGTAKPSASFARTRPLSISRA